MNILNKCVYCEKKFSTKQNTLLHMNKCNCKKLYEENTKIKEELEKIKLEVIKKDEVINFQKSLLENYKNPLNQNNTQNNITIFNTTSTPNLKDLIANLEPIDFNEMKSSFENDLTNKYIDKGIEGIAKFICDIPCQNKILTTDYSRKVITYKTQENIIVDPKGSILLNTALKQNVDTIIDKTEDRYKYWKTQVKDAKDDEIEPDETDVENKNHTKKLLHITTKVKKNVSVSPVEATNIFVMKGIENKTCNAIEG